MSGERILEAVDPADAFAALSDPARVDVVRALWEADGETVSFSELREAVGMRDSGRFNYHLDKLTDRFVDKDGDGYRLTTAGRHVVGGLLAGAYTMEGRIDPIPVEAPCPFCGGQRTFRYEAERVTIDCDGCPACMEFDVPPGAFAGRDADEIPGIADGYLRTCQAQARAGVCPACSGPIESEVVPTVRDLDAGTDPFGDDADLPSDLADVPLGRYECERCGEAIVTDVGMDLAEHPAVVAFFHDHAIDVRAEPLARFAGGRDGAVVRGRDPLRVAVTFEADGDEIELVVDGELDVVDVERTDR